jgi:molybdopterin molybdotransferase
MGATKLRKPEIAAIALEKISKKKGRTHYIRGFFSVENGKMFVTTTGPQGSGILRSMHEANCLIVLPADCETVNAGDAVTIQLIHHEEIA